MPASPLNHQTQTKWTLTLVGKTISESTEKIMIRRCRLTGKETDEETMIRASAIATKGSAIGANRRGGTPAILAAMTPPDLILIPPTMTAVTKGGVDVGNAEKNAKRENRENERRKKTVRKTKRFAPRRLRPQ